MSIYCCTKTTGRTKCNVVFNRVKCVSSSRVCAEYTPRAPLSSLGRANKWPTMNAVQKFGQPFGFRNPDSVIDCSDNWLPGTIFCKSIPKKKNHENENERRVRGTSEERKRQILFYRPINNVVYTFVVWPFNE